MIRTFRATTILAVAAAATLVGPATARSQDLTGAGSDPEHRLPLTWDRWLDHEEIGERMQLMADTWPEFLTFSSLCKRRWRALEFLLCVSRRSPKARQRASERDTGAFCAVH